MDLIFKSKIDNRTGNDGFGESVTDKSGFRPEIATTRDQIIKIEQGGGTGYTGKYHTDLTKDKKTMEAMSYATSPERDITEIESAKKFIEKSVEKDIQDKIDKTKIEKEKNEIKNSLKTIAENTKPIETSKE